MSHWQRMQNYQAPHPEHWARPVRGYNGEQAEVLVITDNQNIDAYDSQQVMSNLELNTIGRALGEAGYEKGSIVTVCLAPTIPLDNTGSEGKKWEHTSQYLDGLDEWIERVNPRMIVPLGNLAARAVLGRAVKITKVRGQVQEKTYEDGTKRYVFPMLAPGFILRIPEHRTTFLADCATLGVMRKSDYDITLLEHDTSGYEWRKDISDLLGENAPPIAAVDTETTGLDVIDPQTKPICVQITVRPGHGVAVPLMWEYWQRVFPGRSTDEFHAARTQVREFMADPRIRKVGHNLKFDLHVLTRDGFPVANFYHDTQMMAWCVDENLMSKALADLIKIFVPSMAGYSDEFDLNTDKSNMIDVHPDDMLDYGCGDTDATFRLMQVLDAQMRKDLGQYNIYRRIQLPALAAFAATLENNGVMVNQDALRQLQGEIEEFYETERRWLIRNAPRKVRLKHMDAGLSFTRDAFTRDILFSKDGFNLTPVVFTDSTKRMRDPAKRVPSASAKTHMPYFVTHPEHGEYIQRLIGLKKAHKMMTTYVGKESEGTGFWKYIRPDSTIHPLYNLHVTDTGRTSSQNPNGQNIPKRDPRWAKPYRRMFSARPGKAFVSCDLSQAELRMAAWMAMEPAMLKIYAEGGDIHAATAAAVAQIPEEVFKSYKGNDTVLMDVANQVRGSGDFLRKLSPGKRRTATLGDFFKTNRQNAKAVNFGFIYGAMAPTFQQVAKIDYGVDYTLEEAEQVRELYFRTYPKLLDWHEQMRAMVHREGVVKSMIGGTRHMQSIYSNDRGIVMAAERQAINSPIQRIGSELGVMGIVRYTAQLEMRGPGLGFACPTMFIHDDIVTECAEEDAETVAGQVKWVLENPPLLQWFNAQCPIPIASDPEIGLNLADMEEREDIQPTKPEWWDDNEQEVVTEWLQQAR
jgi:uracil-DNA glycosylase family 4